MKPAGIRHPSLTRRALLAVGVVLAVACTAALGGTAGAGARPGAKAMSNVQISVELSSTRWVMGTRFLAKVRLRNGGAGPVEVPTSLSPSEFEFRLTSVQLQSTRILSGEARRLSRDPDPVPNMRWLEALAPGAAVEYTEDLGDYARPPLPSGHYQIVVHWERAPGGAIKSTEISVEVVAPKIGALNTAADAEDALVLLWGQSSDGSTQLVERDAPANSPGDGAASIWATIPSPDAPATAIAVAAYRSRGVHWYGWVEGDRLHVGVAQGATVFDTPAPVPIGLKHPRLSPVAWQSSNSSATFVLLDDEPAASATLVQIKFGADALVHRQQSRLATGGQVSRWAARLDPAQEASAAWVVFGVVTGASTRVVAHEVAPDGAVGRSTSLTARSEPLQALAMSPLPAPGAPAPGFVDALFGPSGEPRRMTFLRLPLDGGPPLIDVAIPVPADATGQPARDWTLAPTAAPVPRVIARLGDQIIGKVIAPGGRGFVLARNATGASELRLEKVGDAWWAVWIDPASGLSYARLPDAG